MNITVINRYNDDKLVFNTSTDHYELSMVYARNNFGENFLDDAELQKRITKNSRRVYNFIYNRGHHTNKSVVTFLLNNTKEGREFLFDVLSMQMEADAENGFNDLTLNPTINVINGQKVGDRYDYRQNLVTVDVEDKIDASSSYFGVSIVAQVPYPFSYFLLARNGR